MGFYFELEKTQSKKIVLVEHDVGTVIPSTSSYWTKYEPGIWAFKYSNVNAGKTVAYSYGEGDYGVFPYGAGGSGTSPALRAITKRAGSLIVDTAFYTLVSSIAELRTIDKAWYFDYATQILYVNFELQLDPWDFTNIALGITRGYADKAGYYNGLKYEPRVKSIPNIRVVRDNLLTGTLFFGDMSIELDNTDGEFDDIESLDIYGQQIRIFLGFEGLDYSEFKPVRTGYFDDYEYGDTTITLKMKDGRERLTKKIPRKYLTVADYQYLSDDLEGKPIPAGYGAGIKKQIAYCINDTQPAPSNYQFIFYDTTSRQPSAIDQVYVDNVEVNHSNESLSGGTFTLSTSDYAPGQKVTVTFDGPLGSDLNVISKPLDVIKDYILLYADIAYSTTTYDTANWVAMTAQLNQDIVYTTNNDVKELIDIISDICVSVNGIFFEDAAGRFSFLKSDPDKSASTNIRFYHTLKKPVRKKKPGEYASSVKVGYDPVFNDKSFSSHTNQDSETTLFGKYRKLKERTLNTYLKNLSSAVDFSDDFMSYYGGVFATFTAPCAFELFYITLLDNIVGELIDIDVAANSFQKIKSEVIGIEYDLNKFDITFTLRVIETVTEFASEEIEFSATSTDEWHCDYQNNQQVSFITGGV